MASVRSGSGRPAPPAAADTLLSTSSIDVRDRSASNYWTGSGTGLDRTGSGLGRDRTDWTLGATTDGGWPVATTLTAIVGARRSAASDWAPNGRAAPPSPPKNY
jgi:hypothetical protein